MTGSHGRPICWARLCALLICITLGAASVAAFGQPRIYSLEKLVLQGTERITTQQIEEELDLYQGMRLNDELVVTVREKLLGLGLFNSVLLYMRKGSRPGLAILNIEVEDDPTVLGSWALGSEVAVTSGEPRPEKEDESAPYFGYRVRVVARNMLRAGYRGVGGIDVDGRGIVRAWNTALGLPRFSKESAQFDGRISVVDYAHRFQDTFGFGQKADAYWSQDISDASLTYGVSMYLNRDRFSVLNAPESIIGPRLGYRRETRLLGFVPSDGFGYGAGFMLPVGETNSALLNLEASYTFSLAPSVVTTLDYKLLTIGTKGLTSRVECRIDLPVGRSAKTAEFAKVFLRFRGGTDRFDNQSLSATEGTIGLRYHSPGFIAEVALKIAKLPDELEPLLSQGEVYE